MSKRKKTAEETSAVDQLRELVTEDGSTDGASRVQTRRGLLKMAGAALAGAAGVAALRAVPAAAATGQAVLQGCYNFASPDAPTYLLMAGAASPMSEASAAFIGRSTVGLRGAGYYTTNQAAEVGVLGISKGVGSQDATGAGTGVLGVSNSGIGVNGIANTGPAGLFTSQTGYDVQAGFPVLGGVVGTGRLAMVGRFDANNTAPNIPPAFTVTSTGTYSFAHELVRGSQGTIWASRYAASGTNQSRWKRINAVRVDTADGTGGAYKPFRVVDTRSGAKKAAGTTNPHAIAGQGTGAQAIPGDAIAVIGNLTATAYTGPGYLTLFPTGVANPGTSSINFITGQAAIANAFVCGLGGGSISVYVGVSASHYIIDVTGYIQ